MAIWDEITKGAKDAAAFTMKKTGELTNVAKLKLALHGETSKLEKCYQEIGELYYDFQRKGTDHAADIAPLLLEADDLIERISTLKTQLASAQNSIICSSCGKQVPVESSFCPVCGKKLEETPADEPKGE